MKGRVRPYYPRASAGDGHCSPAVVCSMHRRRTPARRIVDFQGDPLAALQSALERPPSPSPFQLSKDDESVSHESSVSGARLPMLRSANLPIILSGLHLYQSRCSKIDAFQYNCRMEGVLSSLEHTGGEVILMATNFCADPKTG